MSQRIEPALTPEEWEELLSFRREAEAGGLPHKNPAAPVADEYYSGRLHAMAAEALYGEPFGFTWEDVDGLRNLSSGFTYEAEENEAEGRDAEGFRFASEKCADLADRIAALLPPREEKAT